MFRVARVRLDFGFVSIFLLSWILIRRVWTLVVSLCIFAFCWILNAFRTPKNIWAICTKQVCHVSIDTQRCATGRIPMSQLTPSSSCATIADVKYGRLQTCLKSNYSRSQRALTSDICCYLLFLLVHCWADPQGKTTSLREDTLRFDLLHHCPRDSKITSVLCGAGFTLAQNERVKWILLCLDCAARFTLEANSVWLWLQIMDLKAS